MYILILFYFVRSCVQNQIRKCSVLLEKIDTTKYNMADGVSVNIHVVLLYCNCDTEISFLYVLKIGIGKGTKCCNPSKHDGR